MNKSAKIRELLLQNVPDDEINKRLGIKTTLVSVVKSKMRRNGLLPFSTKNKPLPKSIKKWKNVEVKPSTEHIQAHNARVLEKIRAINTKPDMVNDPPHYEVGGIKTIDFIESKKLNYRLGNVIKYVTRAQFKGDMLQDLEKAQWYLNREIQMLKGSK